MSAFKQFLAVRNGGRKEVKMTHRQERAIQALLECKTKAQAAKNADVGVSTLRRWMREDAAFMAAYREAVSEILESTTRKAQRAAGEAVDVLKEIMLDTDAQAGSRVSAADKILAHAEKLTESLDTARRIEEIERTISSLEGS